MCACVWEGVRARVCVGTLIEYIHVPLMMTLFYLKGKIPQESERPYLRNTGKRITTFMYYVSAVPMLIILSCTLKCVLHKKKSYVKGIK